MPEALSAIVIGLVILHFFGVTHFIANFVIRMTEIIFGRREK